MARDTVKAVRYTCDGCGTTFMYDTDVELADVNGYHGNAVTYVYPTGGQACKNWFACTSKCIGTAVESAIQRENENG